MTLPNRAGFIRTNYLEAATFSADNEVAGYEASNVVDSLHYERWRSAVIPSTLSGDFGAQKTIRAFIVRFQSGRDPNESFSPKVTATDTITIKLSNVSSSGSELLSVAINPTVDENLGYFIHILTDTIDAQYFSIEFNLASQAAVGYFEIEEVQIGDVWQPAQNYQEGAEDSEEDGSDSQISDLSAATFSQARARRESFERLWETTDEAEFEQWKQFRRTHGIVRRFVYINKTGAYAHTNVIIGKFATSLSLRRGLEGRRYFVRASIIENR